MLNTKSICTDEIFSVIDRIEKQRENGTTNGIAASSEDTQSGMLPHAPSRIQVHHRDSLG